MLPIFAGGLLVVMKQTPSFVGLEHEKTNRWWSSELTIFLVQIAGIVVGESACVARSSCDGVVPLKKNVDVAADVACKVAAAEWRLGEKLLSTELVSVTECSAACGGFTLCALPDDYVEAYRATQGTASGTCPTFPNTVRLMCTTVCE